MSGVEWSVDSRGTATATAGILWLSAGPDLDAHWWLVAPGNRMNYSRQGRAADMESAKAAAEQAALDRTLEEAVSRTMRIANIRLSTGGGTVTLADATTCTHAWEPHLWEHGGAYCPMCGSLADWLDDPRVARSAGAGRRGE